VPRVRTLMDVDRSLPMLSRRQAIWSARFPISSELADEIGDLPIKIRPYIRAMLKLGDERMAELATRFQVSTARLYDVRMRVCEYLGHDSELVRQLYPKFAVQSSIDREPRCAKCGLRGHLTPLCDLPGIDHYASRRYSCD
jgi:hypothetical protein